MKFAFLSFIFLLETRADSSLRVEKRLFRRRGDSAIIQCKRSAASPYAIIYFKKNLEDLTNWTQLVQIWGVSISVNGDYQNRLQVSRSNFQDFQLTQLSPRDEGYYFCEVHHKDARRPVRQNLLELRVAKENSASVEFQQVEVVTTPLKGNGTATITCPLPGYNEILKVTRLMGATANWLDEEDTVALVHTDQVFQTEEFHGAFIEDSTVSVPIQLAENQTDRYACLSFRCGDCFPILVAKYAREGPERQVTTVKGHQGRSFSFACLLLDEAIFNGQPRIVPEHEENGKLVYTISAVTKDDEGEYWCSSAPERVFHLKLRRVHRNKQ